MATQKASLCTSSIAALGIGQESCRGGGDGYLSEILIVIAGVSGVGAFLQIVPSVQTAMQTAGIAFVIWCAIKALRSAGSANRPEWARNGGETRGQAVVSMLVATRLNPLVYIKIMLLVGVFSSSYDNSLRIWFALGFLGASGVRFCGLPAFGRVLAPWLQSPRAQASFNRLAGLLLLIVAASQAAAIL